MWWPSHQSGGLSQPGQAHPLSRAVMARRMCAGKVRDALPTSRTSDLLPRIIGMTCASQRNRRAWAGLIIAPESKLAFEISPVRASQFMVMVTCGRSPPWIGPIPASRYRPRASIRPCARRFAGGPHVLHGVAVGVAGAVRPGCGQRVDGLFHDFDAVVVQLPFDGGQAGAGGAGAEVEFHLRRRGGVVDVPVGVDPIQDPLRRVPEEVRVAVDRGVDQGGLAQVPIRGRRPWRGLWPWSRR